MSINWPSHDPVTPPPHWIASLAGIVVVAVAAGSLILGFSTGWQRGTPRHRGASDAEQGKVLEAAPLDPTVTLRGVNAAEPPKVEAATNSAREEEDDASNRAEPVEEEAPPAPPTNAAPPPKAEAPPTATPETPAQTPPSGETPPAGEVPF